LGRDIGRLAYPKEDMQTFWITDRAVDYLGQRDQQKPFFLFVSYLDPHSPSHLTEPYWSMFDPQKMPAPNIPEEAKQERAAALQAGLSGPGPTRHFIDDEKMARILTAKYYAKVTMVDDNVGKLLKQIETMGLMDDTIIVFTADHGNMLGDRGRWFKGIMYDGSSRIPLIIKAPNASHFAATFNQGKTVTEIVENTDVMPTLMEMIGLPLPAQPGFQGKSVVNLVAGKHSQWKNIAYAQCDGMMVRTPQYKLVRNTGRKYRTVHSEFELYDLTKDPKEEQDLSADPAHAQVLQELKLKMEAWQQDRPPVPVMEGVEKTVPGSDARPAGKRRRQGR
jgi:arylsulfatase A-like enzyme